MAREHVIQSWVKHDEDDWRKIDPALLDDSDGYSGEQVGRRTATSNGNTRIRATVEGFLPNGKADIDGAADPADDGKGNPLLLVDPAFKVLLDYPGKVAALDAALKAGTIPKSLYETALKVLDAKQEKAQQKIDKLASEAPTDEGEEQEEEIPAVTLEEDEIPPYVPTDEERERAIKNFENSLI